MSWIFVVGPEQRDSNVASRVVATTLEITPGWQRKATRDYGELNPQRLDPIPVSGDDWSFICRLLNLDEGQFLMLAIYRAAPPPARDNIYLGVGCCIPVAGYDTELLTKLVKDIAFSVGKLTQYIQANGSIQGFRFDNVIALSTNQIINASDNIFEITPIPPEYLSSKGETQKMFYDAANDFFDYDQYFNSHFTSKIVPELANAVVLTISGSSGLPTELVAAARRSAMITARLPSLPNTRPPPQNQSIAPASLKEIGQTRWNEAANNSRRSGAYHSESISSDSMHTNEMGRMAGSSLLGVVIGACIVLSFVAGWWVGTTDGAVTYDRKAAAQPAPPVEPPEPVTTDVELSLKIDTSQIRLTCDRTPFNEPDPANKFKDCVKSMATTLKTEANKVEALGN